MRIALVSTPFAAVPPSGYGGTELVVHHLARGLAQAGHEVVLFATGDSQGDDVRWEYERPVWPPDPVAEAIHCAAAVRTIRREHFDLIHAHSPALLAIGQDLGAPVVYTLHHSRDEQLLQIYRARPDVRYVAISHRQAALVPELACDVVHHGLDVEVPIGRGDGDFVLFLGRLSPCKGPDAAVTGASAAGVDLVIAGSLHEEPGTPPSWKDRVKALLANPRVRAVGPVAGRVKENILGRARALLSPFRWEEPFGLVQIEAMLRGTPVVATRRQYAPEVVDEGVTGVLVDGEEELAEAIRIAVCLDRRACRARARERFSTARMVCDYLRVYRDTLADGIVEQLQHKMPMRI